MNPYQKESLNIPKQPSDPDPKGDIIELYTNIYPIQIENLQNVYIYYINISNKSDCIDEQMEQQQYRFIKQQKYKIVQKAKQKIIEKLGYYILKQNYLFCFQDYKDNIQINVEFNNNAYVIEIKKYKQNTIQEIAQDISRRGSQFNQALNFSVKRQLQIMKFNQCGLKGKVFQNQSFQNLGDFPLKIYQGYIYSTQIYGKNPYLMLEHCYKLNRHETVLDIIKKYPKDKAECIISHNSVQANYGNGQNYFISFIDWKKKITDKFNCQGNMISYKDYYKKQYNITLKDENQPLLSTNRINRKTWDNICLVPEICTLNTISEEMRDDRKLMQEIAKHKNISPFQKLQQIDKMVKKISIGFEKDTGIQIKNNEQFSSVEGKIFSPPKLTLKNNVTLNLDTQNDIFEIDKPIVIPAHIKDWVLIYPSDLLEQSEILIQNFIKAAKILGMQVDDPFHIKMQTNDSPQEWVKILENDIKQNGDPLLVVSLVKDRNELLYQNIKQLLIEKYGIVNQNVIAQSLSKNPLSVCNNILLQINAKLGKPLYFCEKVKTLNLKTVFIGIDISTQGKENFVGFTFSLDPQQTQYNSQIQIQKQSQKDFVRNIEKLMINALINFQSNLQRVKFLPECIVVFRGCVDDSQIFIIQELEVKVLKNFLEQSKDIQRMNGGKPYKPEFIFTCIKKKIDQKFFSKIPDKQGNPASNPQPGTLIDTYFDNFQFFLANQRVTQGTCTPCLYTVLENSTKMTKSDFQQLCYWQSYMYFNWKGPIRVPACLMYAQKLAQFYGNAKIKNTRIPQQIENKLFYL